MDFSPVITQALSALWYLIPVAILVGFIKTPWFKGAVGEFQVNCLLKLRLPKDNYHLIKNVTLPTDNGTTQIDHILVSKYGIFVIETKNMKGWIFGSPNQKQWTQKLYKHSSKFQNPIHQNYKHLKTLEGCLGINPDAIFSVIVFIGDSTFKTEMPENVTYAGGCIGFIKAKSVELFTARQVADIVSSIENGRLARGLTTNREHVSHVKQIIEAKAHEKSCPKCGSVMLFRTSKKGVNAGNEFWGCSLFPKCRAVVDVD